MSASPPLPTVLKGLIHEYTDLTFRIHGAKYLAISLASSWRKDEEGKAHPYNNLDSQFTYLLPIKSGLWTITQSPFYYYPYHTLSYLIIYHESFRVQELQDVTLNFPSIYGARRKCDMFSLFLSEDTRPYPSKEHEVLYNISIPDSHVYNTLYDIDNGGCFAIPLDNITMKTIDFTNLTWGLLSPEEEKLLLDLTGGITARATHATVDIAMSAAEAQKYFRYGLGSLHLGEYSTPYQSDNELHFTTLLSARGNLDIYYGKYIGSNEIKESPQSEALIAIVKDIMKRRADRDLGVFYKNKEKLALYQVFMKEWETEGKPPLTDQQVVIRLREIEKALKR